MKKSFYFLAIVLIISFLGGCKKDNPVLPTVVNGQVLERGTNKPLEGVKVVLMEGTYQGLGSGNYSYSPVITVLTDKEGRYTFDNLVKGDSKDYVIWFYKDKYDSITDSQNDVDVDWNKTSSPITKMYPFAWLTIRVINDKPFDEGDKIKIGGPWDAAGLDDIYSGKDVSLTFTKKTRGGLKAGVLWWITKNNLSKFYSDSTYIKPHDTTYYQIKY